VLQDALGRSRRLRGYTYEIVVQGSYANKTNIRAHSDVDLVVQLKMPFEGDVRGMHGGDLRRFRARYEGAAAGWHEFHQDVVAGLRERFFVDPRGKCVDIKDWDSLMRIPADVVPAIEYRHYRSVSRGSAEDFEEGIYFEDGSGKPVFSFPKQHLKNGIRKDHATGGRFKQVVRIVKNARLHAAAEGAEVSDLPSYFVECIVYNVPDDRFRSPVLADAYRECLGWLAENRAKSQVFMCQNELVGLFDDDHAAWTAESVGHLVDLVGCD
jgi:hypothetical protein